MTPALTAARAKWPEAQIDVLVRGGTEGILKGSLAISNIYTSAAPEYNNRAGGQWLKDLELLMRLRKEKYDWVFELSDNSRGRTMAVMAGAKNSATHGAIDFPFYWRPFFNHKSLVNYGYMHRCEKDVELLKSSCGLTGPTPPMEFHRSFADWTWVQQHVSAAPIVVHGVTRWKRKMWEIEKWQELVKKMADVAPVILTSGSNAEELKMNEEIASVAPQRVSVTGGKLSWAQMAGLLYSARMLVSVDTATMHLGAACGVPLVALLGPTFEVQWGPWKCTHELIVPQPATPIHIPDRRLSSVAVRTVWEACGRMLDVSAKKA